MDANTEIAATAQYTKESLSKLLKIQAPDLQQAESLPQYGIPFCATTFVDATIPYILTVVAVGRPPKNRTYNIADTISHNTAL